MRGNAIKLILAGALALSMTAPSMARKWHSDDTAALVGGLVIGGIAAAAISNDYRHRDQWVPPPPPPPPPHRPAAPFRPKPNVICYPREYACYTNSGKYLPQWSARYF